MLMSSKEDSVRRGLHRALLGSASTFTRLAVQDLGKRYDHGGAVMVATWVGYAARCIELSEICDCPPGRPAATPPEVACWLVQVAEARSRLQLVTAPLAEEVCLGQLLELIERIDWSDLGGWLEPLRKWRCGATTRSA